MERLLAPALEDMGYAIVRIQISGSQRPTLQIMAERRDDRAMTVEDCAEISRAASAILDVEDPVKGAYLLEVSSPGIDRPLVRREDFTRFAGNEARIETAYPIEGRKRFTGVLLGMSEDGMIALDAGGTNYVIPFAAVAKAKLVLTEDLIRRSMQASARAADSGHDDGAGDRV